MHIRELQPQDREPLAALLRRVENFGDEEVSVALELIDDRLNNPASTYEFCVGTDEETGALLGYVCFGPTPMTERTWDLYWAVVEPARKGQGIGRRLCAAIEDVVRARNGRTIRVETGTRREYTATIRFYLSIGYETAGRIRDFYRDGDDLLILVRRV